MLTDYNIDARSEEFMREKRSINRKQGADRKIYKIKQTEGICKKKGVNEGLWGLHFASKKKTK